MLQLKQLQGLHPRPNVGVLPEQEVPLGPIDSKLGPQAVPTSAPLPQLRARPEEGVPLPPAPSAPHSG
eukprot:13166122-Alexandrium_andersonii.AAC.1